MATLDIILEFFSVAILPGAFKICVVAPIDRVKLLLQTQDINPKILQKTDVKFKGIVDCFRRVLHEQGMRAFWRGSLSSVLRLSTEQIAITVLRDDIRRLIPRYNPRNDFWSAALSNFAYRHLPFMTGYLIAYPFDYAQLRLAADIGRGRQTFKGITDCLIMTALNGGISSLYRGFTASLIGVMYLRGLQVIVFNNFAPLNPFRQGKGIAYYVSIFTTAQAASIIAHFGAHPFDTVSRRLQMESDLPKEQRKYSGFLDCCYKMYREEHMMNGFYKGGATNAILRTVSSSFAMLFYYEMMQPRLR
jgi:solute carrier family 25 (adenine nucleotide translocator) protein 4/5/6/31